MLLRSLILFFIFWLGWSSPAEAIIGNPKGEPFFTPPVVTVSIHVSNLSEVNTTGQTWSFTGFLIYSFQSKDLADGAYDVLENWHPALEIINIKEFELLGVTAEVRDNRVTISEKIRTTVASDFDIKRFPFDTQTLIIAVEPTFDSQVTLVPWQITIGDDKFVALDEWNFLETSKFRSDNKFAPENKPYSRASFTVKVGRNSQYFQQKIIIPIFCITMAGLFIILINIEDEFSTQIGGLLTTGLASLTLWLLTSEQIPKAIDPSILDLFVWNSLAFNLFCLMFLIFVHKYTKSGRRLPLRLFRLSTILCYLITSGVILFL